MCAVRGKRAITFLAALLAVSGVARRNAAQSPTLSAKLHAARTLPTDLELTGDLAGFPRGETRYLTRDDLVGISQPMTISPDDGNFKAAAEVRAIPLEVFARDLGIPSTDMLIADCKDKYEAHYTRQYLARYHPVLITELNGAPLKESKDDDYGPYMIAHVNFKMASKAPALNDEPQIPWGVVRLQFRDEGATLSPIKPRIANLDKAVGYGVAEENCLRCHNVGDVGGLKSGVNWAVLGALAANSPDFFAAYVRDPKSKNPNTQMAASPEYDDATMTALIAYFRKFAPAQKEAH
jgi:cytochrome c2